MMSRINRYIMECKFFYGRSYIFQENELIDTLWNVNLQPQWAIGKNFSELIDTLWNVNNLLKIF